MKENRLTHQLTSYWDSLDKEGKLPHFDAFSPSAIGNAWDQCMLLSLHDANAQSPSYDYYQIGSKAISPQHTRNAEIIQKLEEVIATLKPLTESGQYINAA